MIDTHAHIDAKEFDDDRNEMLERAFDSGVEIILVPGIEPNSFEKLNEIVQANKNIFCGFGIHPHNANDATEDNLKKVEEYAANDKCVAIGEIGLDYYYNFAPRDVQIKAFRNQIKLAKKLEKPVIVHNREADEDTINIIQEYQDGSLEGVFHCFSSEENTLTEALKLNFHISFTGNITYKKSTLSNIVLKTPIEKILLETDSPYMSPVPYRGKRNEPANVIEVAKKIAEIKSKSIDEVIAMTNSNAFNLFKFFIVSCIIILFLVPLTSNAQSNTTDDNNTIYENPYAKKFGFGPLIGINTVVETQQTPKGDMPISYEGLFSYGLYTTYGVFDYLLIQFSYLHSKNNKPFSQSGGLVTPDYHNFLNLSTQWIANPYSRVNFFGTAGVSAVLNKYNGVSSNKFGLNFGLGFLININFDKVGLLDLLAEWRLDFPFGTYQANNISYDNNGNMNVLHVPATSYFSIPRFGIIWFPKF